MNANIEQYYMLIYSVYHYSAIIIYNACKENYLKLNIYNRKCPFLFLIIRLLCFFYYIYNRVFTVQLHNMILIEI